MSNDFYNHDGTPVAESRGLSSVVRAALAAIGAAFDKMPTLAGNANKVVTVKADGSGLQAADTSALRTALGMGTGDSVTFGALTVSGTTTLSGTSTALTQLPGDSSTKIATTAFVQTAALTATLPAQSGNTGKVITTDGSTASWSAGSTNSSANADWSWTTTNTNAGASASASSSVTSNAGSVVMKATSTAGGPVGSLLWTGSAGSLIVGTSGSTDYSVSVAGTTRTTYTAATGYQAHSFTASGAGNAVTWTANHNSQQTLRAINTNAGASAAVSFTAQSDAGAVRFLAASTALGGFGDLMCSCGGGLYFGTSVNSPLYMSVNNAVVGSFSTAGKFDVAAGSGGYTIAGHKTRWVSSAQTILGAAGSISVGAHGGSRVPDNWRVMIRMKSASGGYAAGDLTEPAVGRPVYARFDATNCYIIQTSTSALVANASSGVDVSANSGNAEYIVFAEWW